MLGQIGLPSFLVQRRLTAGELRAARDRGQGNYQVGHNLTSVVSDPRAKAEADDPAPDVDAGPPLPEVHMAEFATFLQTVSRSHRRYLANHGGSLRRLSQARVAHSRAGRLSQGGAVGAGGAVGVGGVGGVGGGSAGAGGGQGGGGGPHRDTAEDAWENLQSCFATVPKMFFRQAFDLKDPGTFAAITATPGTLVLQVYDEERGEGAREGEARGDEPCDEGEEKEERGPVSFCAASGVRRPGLRTVRCV
jgi:hypothetical protein